MPTPHIIEVTSVTTYSGISYYDFGPNQDLGPFLVGSKRYVGYSRQLTQAHPLPDLQYTAIASSPDGITFTCHDQAHAPQTNIATLGTAGAVCLGNDGTTIYTCYYDLSGHLSIVPFLTGTDLYGTILSGGPAVTSHVLISSIRMLSTGVLVVLYGTDEGAFGELKVVTCTTGGVWGTPQTVATDNPTHNLGMSFVPDSAGRAHILYGMDNLTVGSTKSLKYAMFDGAVVTGLVTIESSTFRTFFFPSQGTGRYDAANDRVLFPYQFNGNSGGGGLVLVNAASTAPSVSEDVVVPYDGVNHGHFGVVISADGSTYIFTYEDYTTSEQLVMWQRPANTPGAWTGPTNFWNWDTDPPAPDPSSPGDPSIEENPPSGLVALPGGAYGTIVSFFGGGGVALQQFCNTLYYMESAAAPPPVPTLQLTKTVSGGTASPTDFIVAATGPDTLSGSGGIPPTAVTPGTYVLSESGPPNYTGVWDCGPAVMPTPTSVIVPPSASASAPVQVGTAQYRPPVTGQGPYYFEIGSNLYQVLVSAQGGSPAGLIGVFKRAASDIGGTWTLMNASGSPDQGNQSGYFKATLDPSGTVIHVAYLTVGQVNVRIASYNTSTDTWGPPTVPLSVPSTLTTFAFVQRTDLTFVLVGGSISTFYYATNIGGIWGPVTAIAPHATTVLDGVIDSANTIHVLFNSPTFGCAYQKINASLAIIFPLAPVANAISLTPGGYPSILLWNGYIVIGVVDTAGANPGAAQVLLGSPISAPVFGGTVIQTAGSDTLSYVRPVIGSDGSLNVFYVDTNYSTPKVQISQATLSTSLVWSAPVRFYDALGNPPVNPATPASAQAINALDPIPLTPQGWTIATALNTVTPTYSTGEFIEMGSAGSIAVVCTLTNTFQPIVPVISPCANVVPQPSTDTHFELRRVYATMRPAPRIPVRGS